MTIASLHRTLSRTLLTLGVVSLVACGGGGGGKKKDPAPDTTPNAYSYTATTNAEPSAVITSAPVTITGINAATPVSITGGEYSINGGAFTSAAGTVTSGQTITIRLTAPAANSASASAQLTVGGVAATFTVTTKADTTPNAFAFTAQTNAALNTEYTSSTITVTGIDAATPISIAGGTYSVNGGAFTAAAGTVSVNNTVAVKGTSPSASESTHNVVLTIGGVSATYVITTIADTTPPVAEFKFPTPYTMSEANTVKVRGTATDDHAITRVKVVVRSYKLETPNDTINTTEIDATPKAAGDYSSWTADIPLTALAENEVKVVATDEKQNVIQLSDANKVVIRQSDLRSAFPDEVNQFVNPLFSAIDSQRNRILVSDRGVVWAVNIATGSRSVFTQHGSLCSENQRGFLIDEQSSKSYGVCAGKLFVFNLIDGSFENSYVRGSDLGGGWIAGIALDRVDGRNRLVLVENVYEYESRGAILINFSLDSKEFSLLSSGTEEPHIKGNYGGLAINGSSYLVASGGQHEDASLHKIIQVDGITGKHIIFADNMTGSGESFSSILSDGNTAYISAIAIDEKNSNILIMESLASRILSIGMDSGQRTVFKDLRYIETTNGLVDSVDIDFSNGGLLYVTENYRGAILAIDPETKEKIIVSKSQNDFN